MTDGEKMIYAAVFAKEANLRNPPGGMCRPGNGDEWRRWEADQIASAAEYASTMVEYYRIAGARIIDGWGEDSVDYRMFCAMTGLRHPSPTSRPPSDTSTERGET